MHLFPIKTPVLALSISEEALCLVEVKKQWRTKHLQNIARVPLDRGLIKLSSSKPNIDNPEEFLARLQSLVEPYPRPLSLVLSLPDLCARTTIFDFSTFPTKKQEQAALVHWRFQQDLKLNTAHSRLAFQAYVPASIRNFPSPDHGEAVKVIGTVLRNDIVEQYEKMCLEANLLPVSVGIAGLDIFDLYRPNMQNLLETDSPSSDTVPPGAMFLFLSHWGFTFLAFQEDTPSFIRTKAIGIKGETSDSPASDLNEHQEAKEKNEIHPAGIPDPMNASETLAKEAYPSYTTMKVEREILATLQYYLEAFPLHESTSSTLHLFATTDMSHGHTLLPSADHIQRTLKASGGIDPRIKVTLLSHAAHFQSPKSLAFPQQAALPGYAGLMVA